MPAEQRMGGIRYRCDMLTTGPDEVAEIGEEPRFVDDHRDAGWERARGWGSFLCHAPVYQDQAGRPSGNDAGERWVPALP